MKTLGLAMIVRDSEASLAEALSSVQGLFDEMVVVDTGSTDRTKEIAAAYGARVVDFPWVYDFSVARNFSFDQLHTDWAFWMDSDDVLVGREHWDEMLARFEEKGVEGVLLEYWYAFDREGERRLDELTPGLALGHVSLVQAQGVLWGRCTTTQYRERLVVRDPAWRWLYPIHEALPAQGRSMARYDGVKLIHRRHVRRLSVTPTTRNLDILDRVPEKARDERIWFYYGMEYAQQRRIPEAIQAFEYYLALSTVDDEKCLALGYLGDLYRESGDLDRSAEYYLRAVSVRPQWRDAYAGLLKVEVRRERWAVARHYGEQCRTAQAPETPFAVNPMHEAVGWVGDYVLACGAVGDYARAREELERAVSLVPDDVAHLHNLDVVSVVLNQQAGQRSIAEAIEFFLRQDDAETAALLLARIPPEWRQTPEMREWAGMVNRLCAVANRGGVAPDTLVQVQGATVESNFPALSDRRMQWLIGVLNNLPHCRRILQVGGPLETLSAFRELGVDVDRWERIPELVSAEYDMAVLWGALERAKWPQRFVEAARSAVRPGGWVAAIVPNGPSRKGLAPPMEGSIRFRVFDPDALRKLLGTVRMPTVLPGGPADAGDLVLAVPTRLGPTFSPKAIAIVCPFSPEPWGPWSLEKGIGGSEEAVIRLSRAFARRGHSVVVYGSGWEGVDVGPGREIRYEPMRRYQPTQVLLAWRYPEAFTSLRPFEAEWRALWLHDSIAKDRVASVAGVVDCVWAISDYHAGLYGGLPHIYSGRNGVDPDMFPEWGSIPRNPAKLVYVSTPFRGLDLLLECLPQIRARVPEAEVHAYYGWESAEKMGTFGTPEGRAFRDKVTTLSQQPGVVWHGRVGQPELYREVASAGVWAYPSRHAEEHCISAYIAQGCGAWPVVTPLGALPQSALYGWKVDLGQFVEAVVQATQTEDEREAMATWARTHLSWDAVAEDWERLWSGEPA